MEGRGMRPGDSNRFNMSLSLERAVLDLVGQSSSCSGPLELLLVDKLCSRHFGTFTLSFGGTADVDPGCGPDVDPGCGPDVDPGCGRDVDPGCGIQGSQSEHAVCAGEVEDDTKDSFVRSFPATHDVTGGLLPKQCTVPNAVGDTTEVESFIPEVALNSAITALEDISSQTSIPAPSYSPPGIQPGIDNTLSLMNTRVPGSAKIEYRDGYTEDISRGDDYLIGDSSSSLGRGDSSSCLGGGGDSSSSPPKCHVCGRTFCSRQSVKRHMKLTHILIPKQFECAICRKGFRMKQTLKQHYQGNHKLDESASTELVQRFYAQPDPGEEIPRPFECVICGQAFRLKQTLQQHYKGRHKMDGSMSKELTRNVSPRQYTKKPQIRIEEVSGTAVASPDMKYEHLASDYT